MNKKTDGYQTYLATEPIIVNDIEFWEIVINPECQIKHPDITDELILELAKQLDGKKFWGKRGKDNWEYFEFEPLFHKHKAYRLVWCWDENYSFLGIQNCFRRKKYEKRDQI